MGILPKVVKAATPVIVLGAMFGAAVSAPVAEASPTQGFSECYYGCYNQHWVVAQRAINWGDGDSFTNRWGQTEWFIRTWPVPDDAWLQLGGNNTVFWVWND